MPAQPWSAVESSPQYQALKPDKQKAAKQQYFDEVVAPQVPQDKLSIAKSQFLGTNDNDQNADLSPAEQMAKSTSDSGASLGAWEGATFGFGDELDAATAGAATGVKNLATRATGGTPKYSAGQAYDAVLNQTRANLASYESNHPIQSFASEMLGGLTTGGGVGKDIIKGGETVVGRAGRSALVGAGAGGLAGAGSGQGDDFVSGTYNRLKNAAFGAFGGAGLGAGLGLSAEAIGPAKRLAGYAGKAFRNAFQSASGKTPEEAMKTMKPEELKKYQDIAINYVKELIAKAGGKVENLTEDTAHKMGKPITGAEAIGPNAETQLASLARREGTTGSAAETDFRLRGQERPERIQEDLAKSSGVAPETVQGNMEKTSEALRAKSAPRYEKAYSKPPLAINMDPEFQAIAKQPNFKAGFDTAKKIAANEGREIDAAYDKTTGKLLGKLSWQDLDLIKRSMGANISRSHTNGVGQFISDDVSRADVTGLGKYRDFLFEKNPEYKDAVAHGGEPIRLDEAYKGAKRLMDSKVSESDFNKALFKMSPAEKEATKGGWINSVYEQLRSGKLKPKDTQSANFEHKASVLLGVDKAASFIEKIQQEMRMQGAENRIPPKTGSATAGLIGAASEHDAAIDDQFHGFVDNLIRRGAKVAIARAANDAYFSAIRAARTPEQRVIRDEVGKLLLMKPDKLRATLEANNSKLSPKTREIGRMILHLSAAPVAETATERTDE